MSKQILQLVYNRKKQVDFNQMRYRVCLLVIWDQTYLMSATVQKHRRHLEEVSDHLLVPYAL